MMPTDAIAPYAALALLALATTTWLWFKAKWRRDDRVARLAAGIADERRMSLMQPDPTPLEDTEDLTDAVATLREQSIPVPTPDGMVAFRGEAVHRRCLVPYLRDGARPCDGCAKHLDDVLTGAA